MHGGERHEGFEFDFEKLTVYQKSLEFANEVFSVTRTFDRELRYSLGDQFRRAALSICNNLAEGSRKPHKSRVQYYQYALDSARECIPMITISVEQKGLTTEQEIAFRDRAIHLTSMLYRLIQACGRSATT